MAKWESGSLYYPDVCMEIDPWFEIRGVFDVVQSHTSCFVVSLFAREQQNSGALHILVVGNGSNSTWSVPGNASIVRHCGSSGAMFLSTEDGLLALRLQDGAGAGFSLEVARECTLNRSAFATVDGRRLRIATVSGFDGFLYLDRGPDDDDGSGGGGAREIWGEGGAGKRFRVAQKTLSREPFDRGFRDVRFDTDRSGRFVARVDEYAARDEGTVSPIALVQIAGRARNRVVVGRVSIDAAGSSACVYVHRVTHVESAHGNRCVVTDVAFTAAGPVAVTACHRVVEVPYTQKHAWTRTPFNTWNVPLMPSSLVKHLAWHGEKPGAVVRSAVGTLGQVIVHSPDLDVHAFGRVESRGGVVRECEAVDAGRRFGGAWHVVLIGTTLSAVSVSRVLFRNDFSSRLPTETGVGLGFETARVCRRLPSSSSGSHVCVVAVHASRRAFVWAPVEADGCDADMAVLHAVALDASASDGKAPPPPPPPPARFASGMRGTWPVFCRQDERGRERVHYFFLRSSGRVVFDTAAVDPSLVRAAAFAGVVPSTGVVVCVFCDGSVATTSLQRTAAPADGDRIGSVFSAAVCGDVVTIVGSGGILVQRIPAHGEEMVTLDRLSVPDGIERGASAGSSAGTLHRACGTVVCADEVITAASFVSAEGEWLDCC